MSPTVWLAANTLDYLDGGGHFWVYLNWAIGLRALGCEVVWLEACDPRLAAAEIERRIGVLSARLGACGLVARVALCSDRKRPLPAIGAPSVPLDAAADADLLLNMAYGGCAGIVGRFRRSAMIDIDPGLTQIWISRGAAAMPRHDVYFTIGETVGRAGSLFPDGGISWEYTPPCVSLESWPVVRAPEDAAFTTVSQWHENRWVPYEGELRSNDKRTGFLPFLDLPRRTTQPLELALCLGAEEDLRLYPDQEEERCALVARGWRVRHAHAVASTPSDYQRYIQESRGEFSCVKPSCVFLQNAWISDRTLCYLASGKPAVVQHTGPSRFLPDAAGLFRFRDEDEAVRCLEAVSADYERQCGFARALAVEHFDAAKVARRVLERALA